MYGLSCTEAWLKLKRGGLSGSVLADGSIDLVASGGGGAWRVRTPRLDVSVNGAGDAVAALFFVSLLSHRAVPAALSHAASAIFGLLRATADAGTRELALVPAQDEFVRPSRVFAPEPL